MAVVLEEYESTDVTPDSVSGEAPDMSGELHCPECDMPIKSGTQRGLKRHMTITHGTGGDRAPLGDGAGRRAKKSLEDDLGTMLAALAMGVSMFNATDGAIIAGNADPVARAWSNLAQKNPKVDRMLRNMMGGVSYGEVIMATAMMVIPILANHNLLPAQMVSVLGTSNDGD